MLLSWAYYSITYVDLTPNSYKGNCEINQLTIIAQWSAYILTKIRLVYHNVTVAEHHVSSDLWGNLAKNYTIVYALDMNFKQGK